MVFREKFNRIGRRLINLGFFLMFFLWEEVEKEMLDGAREHEHLAIPMASGVVCHG